MPLSRANSIIIGGRDPLFQTILTPKGTRPSSPAFSPSLSTPKRSRSRKWQACLIHTVFATTTALVVLLTIALYLPDIELYRWRRDGCPTKVLELNKNMNATLEQARQAGLIASDLGNPRGRPPRTAIVNTVKFHTEIIASLVYHFTKLNHNVTVYARDDSLGIHRVIHPFHWKSIRRFERFYTLFYEYDIVVFPTYPTCHLELAANLVASGLPQRYIAVLHNPELLAANGAAAAHVAKNGNIQLMTITPHVNEYANNILEAEGLLEQGMDILDDRNGSVHGMAKVEWFVPIFPVLFPEDCNNPTLVSPSGVAADQPACNRSAVWQSVDASPPGAVLDAQEEAAEWTARRRNRKLNSNDDITNNKNSGLHDMKTSNDNYVPRRRGFCVQGKLDPSRRSYTSLFSNVAARKESLLASDFYLMLLGKLGGRSGASDVLHVPSELEEEGLVRRYTGLPFQEYYEVLHSCLAIMPAFASDAYYLHKGSSSVAASLIADTPLVATPRMLRAYSFLDSSTVFLVPEGTPDVDAIQAVMELPPEILLAKRAAMKYLRYQIYDRNLYVLQNVLGEDYLYKKKLKNSSKNKTKGDGYMVMYYDASTSPLWTAEPMKLKK